jgi:hypothetical protein
MIRLSLLSGADERVTLNLTYIANRTDELANSAKTISAKSDRGDVCGGGGGDFFPCADRVCASDTLSLTHSAEAIFLCAECFPAFDQSQGEFSRSESKGAL